MAVWHDLTRTQKHLANRLYTSVFKALCRNDSTGHIPDCGYTDEKRVCDCLATGTRVMDAIINDVAELKLSD